MTDTDFDRRNALHDGDEPAGEGREKILNAAYGLFVAVGYAEVSMQQIADAAGVTKATLYHHFRGKDELFGAVCRRELQRLRAGIAAQLDGGGTFRAQLELVARFFLEHAVRSDFSRLMTDFERHLSHEQRHACMHGEATPDVVVRPLFERAIAAGELRPIEPEVAIAMFFGMVFGQIKFAQRAGGGHLDRDLAPVIVEVLLHGIGSVRAEGGDQAVATSGR